MNRNFHASARDTVRQTEARWWIGPVLLATVVLGAAGIAFHWAGLVRVLPEQSSNGTSFGTMGIGELPAHRALSASSLWLPLFFEPNQGQSDASVKFLARGSGYGLFLTANEAVLELEQSARAEAQLGPSPNATKSAAYKMKSRLNVIRMRLDGASSAARIRGTEQLPGKSSYYIGNDPSKWHRDIPQFARVEYQDVYPGIDLVYYGNQRQLEYDFRVAPGSDPNQIALSFEGASVRLDSGDLVLATTGGDVRFHAPHIYQPAISMQSAANAKSAAGQAGPNGEADGNAETPVPGSFRQLADNKVGFALGAYDHSRELVIDPVLSYSTYFGLGGESLAKVAVDKGGNIYLAFSTTSAGLTTTSGAIQTGLGGPNAQNIFIAVLNPSASSQLSFATYLGGSGTDDLAGLAVDSNFNIYVAGTTTSVGSTADFPVTSNAFQQPALGTHGFLSMLSLSGGVYTLGYSTYLAGNGTDNVRGLAVDDSQNAYVTGDTTSTNASSAGFPANPNAYQPCPFGPLANGQCPTQTSGPPQFFASKIYTVHYSGLQSMAYSTYFGGGNGTTTTGGGIAVDTAGYMYFTGTTNMQNATGLNNTAAFPILNAYQSCLNQPGFTGTCTTTVNPDDTDAILVKINPNQPASPPLYSTYLGGSLSDAGVAVAVDTSSNAYVTGSTISDDWACPAGSCTTGLQAQNNGQNGNSNAFIAKIGNPSGSLLPLIYFTYLGGPGPDIGQAIAVDSIGAVHLAGSASPGLTTLNSLPQDPANGVNAGDNGDALVALIATTATTTGDYVTYLGGNQLDVGTGVALDVNNATYVAGSTYSDNFPLSSTPYQSVFQGAHDAFVTKIGSNSVITVATRTGSPNPNPVAAGAPAAFTFDLMNTGTDTASDLNFYAIVPTTGTASTPSAKVISVGGSCGTLPPGGNTISCLIPTLSVNATASVEVDVTPSVPATVNPISVQCTFSVNGGAVQSCPTQVDQQQQDPVVDFSLSASPSTITIPAGDLASFPITLTPQPSYNATITMSQTTSPSIVTATTPTFTNPTVTLSGSGQGTTTLNIQTVARPVTTGQLFHRSSLFYATWLPIGGLSLVGLGIGVGRKRRRWLGVAAFGLVASLILLQPACSSSSSSTTTTTGTQAQTYTVTVTASPSIGGAHNIPLTLIVQ